MAGKTRKSLSNKNKIICLQCKTEVLESEDKFQCDACNKTLHSVCTKMDKKQIDKLLNDDSLEYKCHFCLPADNNFVASELAQIKTQLNQLSDIRETIQFMSSQYDTILKGLATNKKQIDSLQKENKMLRNEVHELKSSVKFLNDIRVQKNCIVNGVAVKNETIKPLEVVLDLAKQTGADICEDEIEDCYFLNNNNKTKSNENNKKSLVIKFVNKKSKTAFMDKKAKLKEIEDLNTVFINDFLSKESLELFNHAKTLKTVGYKFVYSRGGSIFARKTEKTKQIKIKSMDEVDKMLLGASGGRVRKTRANTAQIETSDDEDDGDDDEGSFRSPN